MKIIQKTENEKKGMSQRLKKRQNMREEQGINKKRGKANWVKDGKKGKSQFERNKGEKGQRREAISLFNLNKQLNQYSKSTIARFDACSNF